MAEGADSGEVDLRGGVLTALASEVPLVARPFAAVARALGAEEAEVLSVARELRAERALKSLCAVFEPSLLGYRGTLAAVSVAEEAAEDVAHTLAEHASVTHVFERDDRYNVWFVVASEGAARLRSVLDEAVARAGAHDVLALADDRVMKLTLDFSSMDADADHGLPAAALTLAREDRALVRLLQTDLPLVARPFRELAATLTECGYDVDEDWVLEHVVEWARAGVLKRIAAVTTTHRAALPVAVLALWPFSEGGSHASSASAALAADSAVAHCYRVLPALVTRPTVATLVLAASRAEAEETIARLRHIPGLDAARVAYGVREVKRAPVRYFAEGDG